MYPYLRGNVASAVNLTDAAASYNYCNTVLLHWITYAFSGWRGSMRWKLLPRGEFTANRPAALMAQRAPIGGDAYVDTTSGVATLYPTRSAMAASAVNALGVLDKPPTNQPFSGVRGMVYSNGQINNSLEFEIPYYSPFRFVPGKVENYTSLLLWTEGFDLRIFADGAIDSSYDAYVATGEDFQAYFWTGLPPMYYEPTPPVPAQL